MKTTYSKRKKIDHKRKDEIREQFRKYWIEKAQR